MAPFHRATEKINEVIGIEVQLHGRTTFRFLPVHQASNTLNLSCYQFKHQVKENTTRKVNLLTKKPHLARVLPVHFKSASHNRSNSTRCLKGELLHTCSVHRLGCPSVSYTCSYFASSFPASQTCCSPLCSVLGCVQGAALRYSNLIIHTGLTPSIFPHSPLPLCFYPPGNRPSFPGMDSVGWLLLGLDPMLPAGTAHAKGQT